MMSLHHAHRRCGSPVLVALAAVLPLLAAPAVAAADPPDASGVAASRATAALAPGADAALSRRQDALDRRRTPNRAWPAWGYDL